MPLSDLRVSPDAVRIAETSALDRPGCAASLACIVTHDPNGDDLVALVLGLKAVPGLQVVLIDNSESQKGIDNVHAIARSIDVLVLANRENRGVAYAHNQAAEHARSLGLTRLLLLDQDSQIGASSVEELHSALKELTAQGTKAAAVGPVHADRRTDVRAPFVRLTGVFRMTRLPSRSDEPVECDLLISSGCLMPLAVFDQVGSFDEDLFIDYVDIEWCARARSMGFKVFGIPKARMQHSIGDRVLRIFGRCLPVHSPSRQYYLVRNALLFARRTYLPLNWRLHLVFRAITQFIIFSCFCAPRFERARWLGLGLWHGVKGRTGRLAVAGRPSTNRELSSPCHAQVIPPRVANGAGAASESHSR